MTKMLKSQEKAAHSLGLSADRQPFGVGASPPSPSSASLPLPSSPRPSGYVRAAVVILPARRGVPLTVRSWSSGDPSQPLPVSYPVLALLPAVRQRIGVSPIL